jgi:PKHD-type hydroxylase
MSLDVVASEASAPDATLVPEWASDRLRVFPAAVAKDACERIVERCDALKLEPGPLHNNTTGGRFYDPSFRLTSVGWLAERDWIYDLMYGYAEQVNRDWGFILGDADHLQYAVYQKNDFFEHHKDMLRVRTGTIRKVSVVLQLDPPEAYRGGRLDFLDDDYGPFRLDAFAAQGSVAVFASLLKHRVTPIKEGKRRSLTAWFKGPPFR